MKKIIQLLYILFAVAAFSACSDDNQGEVVSQGLVLSARCKLCICRYSGKVSV